MRLPCLRLRLRTLLIAVAVAGVALGGLTIWERRQHHLQMAAACAFAFPRDTGLARYHRWAAAHPWLDLGDPVPVIGDGVTCYVDSTGRRIPPSPE